MSKGRSFSEADIQLGSPHSFSQAEIDAGEVYFRMFNPGSFDYGAESPINITVSDAVGNTLPGIVLPLVFEGRAVMASGTFIPAPFLQIPEATITVQISQAVTITPDELTSISPQFPHDQITYSINHLPESGTLFLNHTELPLDGTFTQADIDQGKLVYVEDGSPAASDLIQLLVSDPSDPTWPPVNVNVTIQGTAGGAVLTDALGGTILYSGPGNNWIIGKGGAAALSYASAPAGVSVDLATGAASNGFGGTDTISGINTVIGSAHDDELVGGSPAAPSVLAVTTLAAVTPESQTFFGGAGNNTIMGGTDTTNTAGYADPLSDYQVTYDDGALTVSSPSNVDALANIQTLQFADAALTTLNPDATTAVSQFDDSTGTGHIFINGGTTVAAGAGSAFAPAGLVLGGEAGGEGDATILGTGASLTNVGQLIIGDLGFGSLSIQNGGAVATSPGSGPAAATEIAARAGSDGSNVSVTGNGSGWQVGGLLVVGDAASGTLNISAGGSVTASALEIGNQSAGAGHVAIAGAASSVSLSGDLAVGVSGSANLSIANGATVTAGAAEVGADSGGSGVIDIEGAGSELQVTSNMIIGEGGTGAVILGAGSTLNVAGTLTTSAFGRLVLLGGVVDPQVILNQPGSSNGPAAALSADVEIDNAGTYFAAGNSISALGTLSLTAPLITNDHTVGDIGLLQVLGFGDLVLNAATIDNTQTVEFGPGSNYELLTIDQIGHFGAIIDSFNTHAEIIVQGISIASTSFVANADGSGVLSLFNAGDDFVGALDVSSNVAGARLTALETPNADGGLGALPCFAAGTRIATERGWVAAEKLRAGDRVRTLLGGGLAPVVWVGWRRVECRRHKRPREVWPVQVAAGAFGPGVPERDVWLSPDHAVFFDDVLIPVKHLIDGGTIAQVAVDEVTYYHVELLHHDVLLADGLPAESYLDTGDRSAFANGGGAVALYPDFAALRWEAAGCAPLVVTGAVVERARRVVSACAADSVVASRVTA